MRRTLASLIAAFTLSCGGCDNEKLVDAGCRYRQEHEVEACDNVDNNCDGIIDQYESREVCGLNGRGEKVVYCEAGGWTDRGECNDKDLCTITQQRSYYTGHQFTRGKGECRDGIEVCTDNVGVADYVKITQDILPSPELCDGLDNNCDGTVDNYELIPAQVCWGVLPEEYHGVGACRNGWFGCGDTECRGVSFPTPEVCDGVDNNCDRQVDDGFTEVCVPNDNCQEGSTDITYTGPIATQNIGECKDQISVCVRGSDNVATWNIIQQEVSPREESCDYLDEDRNCNGKTALEENRREKAYVLFFYDKSGSMAFKQANVAGGMCGFANNIALDPTLDYRFGLAFVPDIPDESRTRLVINYLPSAEFYTECTKQDFNSTGAFEIFYDGLHAAADGMYGLHSVPSEVDEFYVSFTDGEEPWSRRGYTENDVLMAVQNKGAIVYMFRPSVQEGITEAFDSIVSATGGMFYELTDSTLSWELMGDLEDIISKCKR